MLIPACPRLRRQAAGGPSEAALPAASALCEFWV